jgi:hypothetical protein
VVTSAWQLPIKSTLCRQSLTRIARTRPRPHRETAERFSRGGAQAAARGPRAPPAPTAAQQPPLHAADLASALFGRAAASSAAPPALPPEEDDEGEEEAESSAESLSVVNLFAKEILRQRMLQERAARRRQTARRTHSPQQQQQQPPPLAPGSVAPGETTPLPSPRPGPPAMPATAIVHEAAERQQQQQQQQQPPAPQREPLFWDRILDRLEGRRGPALGPEEARSPARSSEGVEAGYSSESFEEEVEASAEGLPGAGRAAALRGGESDDRLAPLALHQALLNELQLQDGLWNAELQLEAMARCVPCLRSRATARPVS